MAEKRCIRCGEEKPLADFCADASKADGLMRYCRSCNTAHTREWKLRNRERVLELNARSRDRNRAELRRKGRDYSHRASVNHHPEGFAYSEILRSDPCCYCGGPAEAIDHIEPRALGADHDPENLTAACKSCNSRKQKRRLLYWLAIR